MLTIITLLAHVLPYVFCYFHRRYHPFGPFSTTSHVSDIFLDHIVRNSVLVQVDRAYSIVRQATQTLEHFIDEYVVDMLGENIVYSSSDSSYAFFAEHQANPLARDVVTRLRSELKRLEEQFLYVGKLLHEFKMADAHTAAASLFITAEGFSKYVNDEIHTVKTELRCCRKEWLIPASGSASSLVLFLALTGLVAGGMFWWLQDARDAAASRPNLASFPMRRY
jgi:hypothetical protein